MFKIEFLVEEPYIRNLYINMAKCFRINNAKLNFIRIYKNIQSTFIGNKNDIYHQVMIFKNKKVDCMFNKNSIIIK